MPKGPVLSKIYDLISEEPQPGVDSFWRDQIEKYCPDLTGVAEP